MKPHQDALALILMLGDAPDEVTIDRACGAAGLGRSPIAWLAMQGYIKSAGTVDVDIRCKFRPRLKNASTQTQRVLRYSVTEKGLRYLE